MVTNTSLEDGDEFSSPVKRASGVLGYLKQEISTSWTDAILLVGCFTTGLLDAAVFNEWSCFVSMQTGNTIYAGLGVTNQPNDQPYRWIMALTSILSYIFGCFLFSRLFRSLGPLRRGTMMTSFTLQSSFCFISAILVQVGVVPIDASHRLPGDLIVLVPIALLSVQAGGQTIVSRFLGFSELPSVVLTSTYCDLGHDPELFTTPLFKGGNQKRNRRVVAVVLLLAGAMLGGVLTKDVEVTHTLWVCGAIKAGIVVLLAGWKRKEEESVRLE